MADIKIGDQLNKIVRSAKAAMFNQAELAQLTYTAFDLATESLKRSETDENEVTFAIGYRSDKTQVQTTRTYKNDQLLKKYEYLSVHRLSTNELIHIVTLIEAMLEDVVRTVLVHYPKKLGSKRTMTIYSVLEASSLDEIKSKAIDGWLNELSYKSPREFSETIDELLSFNLMECPAYVSYLEVKASRDIFIHSRGTANETYVRKAGQFARASVGELLPVSSQYFFESYECCLCFSEWLEEKLHLNWHSDEYESLLRKREENANNAIAAPPA